MRERSDRIGRIAAIVRTDVRVRFRRPSTAVVFLLLSAIPYLWIPDPATGRALLQSAGRRALYDSAALGMATAAIATIFIGLFGFYVISNAVRRDVDSRCGFVLASTTMTSGEYVVGKLVGNVVFMTTFIGGFMLTSMAMQLVRGEAPLEPLVFLDQYLLLLPPAIVLVAALAITFESVPLLAGRFGDVVYFFLWIGTLGVVVSALEGGGGSWLHWFDYSGLGLVLRTVRTTLGTDELSIGASTFDPTLPTMIFPGLLSDPATRLQRLGSTLTPLALLVVARFAFHRFDPARVKARAAHARRGWIAGANGLVKPLARRVAGLLAGSGRASRLAAARTDAVLTLTAFPLVVLAMVGIWIAALAVDGPELAGGLLPIALAGLAIAVADVVARDRRSGTLRLLRATPHLREGYVRWKLAGTLLFALLFLLVPLARLAVAAPTRLPGAFAGVVFVVAGATCLGVVSGNAKTFVVLFLSLWYMAMNDKGATPSLDFGGFYPTTPWTVAAGYGVVSVALVVGAELWHRRELARE